MEEGPKLLISAMIKDGTLILEKIASLAKVSVEYVKQVAKELKEKG
jgi:DNA-binding IscR family transcriptional regulator